MTAQPGRSEAAVRIWSIGDFVRVWVGESASAFGVAMSSVLLSLIAVVQLDASALWMGVIGQVVGYAVSVVMLASLRHRTPATAGSSGRTATDPQSLLARIRDGPVFTIGDRFLRWFTICGCLANFGLTGSGTLMVIFLVRKLGLSSQQLGAVMALTALGNLAGALIAPRLGRRLGSARVLQVGSVLVALGSVAVPLTDRGPRMVLGVAGYALVGMAVVFMNVTRQAWRQGYVPEALMGRSSTASQVLNVGLMPLAAVVAGALSGPLGVRTTIALMCAVTIAANLAILASPIRGLRVLPERAPAPPAPVLQPVP